MAYGARGFSLLESLIATVVFTVGVVAITQALSVGIPAFQDIGNTDLALNIAESRLEQFKNTAFGSIRSSGPSNDANFPLYRVTVTVTGTDPKNITVRVQWTVKGGTPSVSLRTLRANY